MNLVFYKRRFEWPLRTGAAVHAGNLMRQLAARGHHVAFWTQDPVSNAATEWLEGIKVDTLTPSKSPWHGGGWWSQRFQKYWGDNPQTLAAFRDRVRATRPDAIVGVGPEVLPALSGCDGTPRVWYAADDPALHQFSLAGWRCKMVAAKMAVYEFALKRCVDTTWVVSEPDRRWSRRLGGGDVRWLPNGVDSHLYSPLMATETPNSCVFWGNLSFAPNCDAVEHLLRSLWPTVKARVPNARLRIAGCAPPDSLRVQMESAEGVEFFEDLSDLRPLIAESQVAIFPLISGAGVKNKVLEAAAMGRPIVATPRCLFGLAGNDIPIEICKSPAEWSTRLAELWTDANRRRDLAERARQWVTDRHQWEHTAAIAEESLSTIVSKRLPKATASPSLVENTTA